MMPPTLHSPLLARAGFSHAFFTRQGGVSEGPFASLNTAISTGDDLQHVEQNLARIADVLGVPSNRVFFLSQTHGVACRVVTYSDERREVAHTTGDVVLARDSGLACAVRTADCAPVLIADIRSGAVCAVHSGWRGTEADVVAVATRALRDIAGPRAELVAAIGPHISADAFEVDDDVAMRLAAASPLGDAVIVRRYVSTRPYVDLRRLLRAQLTRAGVDAIDDVFGCTVQQPALFFSYRREGPRSGRLLSAIVPRGLFRCCRAMNGLALPLSASSRGNPLDKAPGMPHPVRPS